MKITKSKFIYNIIANSLVCLFLCLGSALLAGKFDVANFFINFGVSFTIAMMIGLFIPLVKIGKWFTRLFKVDDKTYTGNIKYRVLATISTTIIYFIIINPFLAILNAIILGDLTWHECFLTWLINIPAMLIIGFISSLIADIFAYKAAKRIDENF